MVCIQFSVTVLQLRSSWLQNCLTSRLSLAVSYKSGLKAPSKKKREQDDDVTWLYLIIHEHLSVTGQIIVAGIVIVIKEVVKEASKSLDQKMINTRDKQKKYNFCYESGLYLFWRHVFFQVHRAESACLKYTVSFRKLDITYSNRNTVYGKVWKS